MSKEDAKISLRDLYHENWPAIWLGIGSSLGLATIVLLSQTDIGKSILNYLMADNQQPANSAPTETLPRLIGTEPVASNNSGFDSLGGTPVDLALYSPLEISLGACPQTSLNWRGKPFYSVTYVVTGDKAIRLFCSGQSQKGDNPRAITIEPRTDHLEGTSEYSRIPVVIDPECKALVDVNGSNIRVGDIFLSDGHTNIVDVSPQTDDGHTFIIEPRNFDITSLFTHVLNFAGSDGTTVTITDLNDCGLVRDNLQ